MQQAALFISFYAYNREREESFTCFLVKNQELKNSWLIEDALAQKTRLSPQKRSDLSSNEENDWRKWRMVLIIGFFLDSFMSLDQSQLFYLYLPSQESMNYKNKGKTVQLRRCVWWPKVEKANSAWNCTQKTTKKEGKTRGLLIFCSYCFFLLAGSVTAN